VDRAALAGLRELGGDDDPDFFPSVVRTFLEHLDRGVAALAAAVAERDAARVKAVAHGLKGGAGHVGARPFAGLCKAMEGAALAGLTDADVLVAAITDEAARVRARLAQELAPTRAPARPPRSAAARPPAAGAGRRRMDVSDARRETPAKLGLDLSTQRLTITWHDGHVSGYGGAYLRFLCPCAGCRGHAPGEVIPPSWEQVKDVRAVGASQVGGYALSILFSDGHGSGIYAYDRLRDACPCPACGRTDVPPGA
jgi:DUF971 family protein/HPt (histidine-containing phosphotransfer) domain-containing protein